MSSPGDPLDELSIPDGTTVEEHDIVTDSDVLVGSNSRIEFGVRSRTVAAGERVDFGRHLEVDTDCRLDMLCEVDGSVLVGSDAYIGARVHIGGQLLVSGDLDIGDDVEIDEGFETNGWIHTRNPVPALVFYFIVLSQFLRFGEDQQAEEFASALTGADAEQRPPLVIPRGAELSDDAWRVSTPATIGDDCRLHGNIRAASIAVGSDTTIFGSLRAREDIEVGSGTVVIGDVTTRNGTVTLQAGCEVRGDVSCQELVVHEGADVDGALRAKGDMKLVRRAETASEPASDDGTTDSQNDGASTDPAEQSATDST
ncbi:MAG: polymer-forming cytoskeletal protein [Halohasta sp.]